MNEIDRKIQLHETFWSGKGPSLLFTPSASMVQYDVENYKDRFYDPAAMYAAEQERALQVLNWPTDGIPSVRPNLGTVFVPAIAGQSFVVSDGQMPWPGKHLSMEQIATIKDADIDASDVLKLAGDFYKIHGSSPDLQVAAYHADTQGVYDILHLLRGDELFCEMITDADDVNELLEIVTTLYIRVTEHLKNTLSEPRGTMIHGHGTPQGLYFPSAGVRLSEDTATLISPDMIDEFVIPYMKKAAAPFGGAFVHYCGKHEYLYEQIVNCDFTRAIDLGNPEMYDTEWLLENCARTNTVFYGKLAEQKGESWQAYIHRLATLVKKTGARCALRPAVFPEDRSECQQMLDLWHQLTSE